MFPPILPIPPIPPTVWPAVLALLSSRFDRNKDEKEFQKKLKEIQEENKKNLEAAQASIKTQQETRVAIQREMFKKQQELLNYINTEVASRFDQLIELRVQQNVHNAHKRKQIEDDLNSLSNSETELRKILSEVN